MTNGSLMKVQSIAECSKGSILQCFRPALGLENQFLVHLRLAVLHRFYCSYFDLQTFKTGVIEQPGKIVSVVVIFVANIENPDQ